MDARTLPEPVPPQMPRRLSQVLREFVEAATGPVSVEAIRDTLGDRSFAALLFVFAAINLLPLPPGSSIILGIPLVLLTLQMAIGRRSAWLPRFILQKTFRLEHVRSATNRLIPWLERLETIIRPRYWPIPRGQTDKVIGSIGLILAIAVTVPIPFGNWPPAFASALLGLALSERDGILLSFGLFFGALSLGIIALVISAAGAAAGWLFTAF